MVVACVVVGCTSRCVDGSLSFHHIPKEEKRSDVNIAKTVFVDDISTLNRY